LFWEINQIIKRKWIKQRVYFWIHQWIKEFSSMKFQWSNEE
jgi:hypothetical protein